MSLIHQLRDAAASAAEKTVAIRRELHRNPELSFEEFGTQRFIEQRLVELGIPHRRMANTGVVAEIRNGAGPTVALRADMDALPIREATGAEYASRNPGVMHACGHDVHTASLLGVAELLMGAKDHVRGAVRMLFQPGEEKLPGGASVMIREGALRDPAPAAIFGQHVHPPLAAGKVGFRPGIYMASTDELHLEVRGRGGHGAMPHTTVDPIVIAAQIITAVQNLVSRQTDPTLPAVITFGHIASDGGATNVIPNKVTLQGTLRTLDEDWRKELHRRLTKLVSGVADALGGSAELTIAHGYPFLNNDVPLTNWARRQATDLLGKENVVDLPIRMTGEDFAFYTHHVPACFYRLGVRNEAGGITSPVHTDTFDVDEKSLETGPALMAYLAIQRLASVD